MAVPIKPYLEKQGVGRAVVCQWGHSPQGVPSGTSLSTRTDGQASNCLRGSSAVHGPQGEVGPWF